LQLSHRSRSVAIAPFSRFDFPFPQRTLQDSAYESATMSHVYFWQINLILKDLVKFSMAETKGQLRAAPGTRVLWEKKMFDRVLSAAA
jgi:hypothetical protein